MGSFIFTKEGYCEESSRGHYRVFTFMNCSNKAKYEVTFHGRTMKVCGTHLREYYNTDWEGKPIKGDWLKGVEKVIDLKTGKIIYEKS